MGQYRLDDGRLRALLPQRYYLRWSECLDVRIVWWWPVSTPAAAAIKNYLLLLYLLLVLPLPTLISLQRALTSSADFLLQTTGARTD